MCIRGRSASPAPRPLDELGQDPAEEDARDGQKAHREKEGGADGQAREGRHRVKPPDRTEEERLGSGKAVAAALLLLGVLLAAAIVFLWVVFTRACVQYNPGS